MAYFSLNCYDSWDMKIIFSRKGFDSGSGGVPSPIIGGRPISLPIPTPRRSVTTYEDLGLGEIVEHVTRRRIKGSHLCHHDPMFERGRWAFGQVGAAQSHLVNQGVAIGDVFLFFGLFADEHGQDAHHRIFGYLDIEKIAEPGVAPTKQDQPAGFTRRHPHTVGEWKANNSIYIGFGGLAPNDNDALRLTAKERLISQWSVPPWLQETGLSYHGDPKRWQNGNILHTAYRGQEFVSDISGVQEAADWLNSIKQHIDKN